MLIGYSTQYMICETFKKIIKVNNNKWSNSSTGTADEEIVAKLYAAEIICSH